MRLFTFAITIVILALATGCDSKSSYDPGDSTTWPNQAMDVPMEELGRRSLEAHRRSLLEKLDTTHALIDLDDLFIGNYIYLDSIPSLTNPLRIKASDASYPSAEGRVVVVDIAGEAVAYPIGILTWHEIMNDMVGDIPIAVVYCPLCDSVSVMNRTLSHEDETGKQETLTLEFGVSGFLYNSNVVMFERSTMALWSQVWMQAMTGPHAGESLEHLPFRMMLFEEYQTAFPEGEVLSTDTGHPRDYQRNPYESYATTEELFMEFEYGTELPAKTLGLGVQAGEFVAFYPMDALPPGLVKIETPLGELEILVAQSGIQIDSLPEGVKALQSHYHAWSAFFPESQIIRMVTIDESTQD